MRWEFANVAVVVLTLACADSATEPMAEHTYFVAASVSKQDEARTEIERSFLDIESRSPGFAGYYFEGETLVTMSASPTSDINALFEEAKGALARNGRSDMAAITSVSHRHRNVGYSFRQLAFWREAAGERILDLSGTISLDVDEIRNRLVVGYISTADRGELQEVLDQAHVPTSAVLVVTEEPVVRTQTTLDSRVRPLTSGTRFGRYTQDWGPSHNYSGWWTALNWCTLGVPAIRQGVQVLLVVSHCTAREGALDDDPQNWVSYYIGQDWYPQITGQTGFFPPGPFGYNPFGNKLFDRAGWTCGPAYDRRPCRHAETAVWDLSGMEIGFGETPFLLGRIARTTGSLPGTNPAGFTRTIDPARPYFTIVGEVVNPIAGDVVQKVGLTTGWTFGAVYQTCVDINHQTPGNVKRRVMCYDRADLGGNGGDSGSPVFRIVDAGAGTVLFYGLASFRGTDRVGSTGFGSVRQLRGELGAFQVF